MNNETFEQIYQKHFNKYGKLYNVDIDDPFTEIDITCNIAISEITGTIIGGTTAYYISKCMFVPIFNLINAVAAIESLTELTIMAVLSAVNIQGIITTIGIAIGASIASIIVYNALFKGQFYHHIKKCQKLIGKINAVKELGTTNIQNKQLDSLIEKIENLISQYNAMVGYKEQTLLNKIMYAINISIYETVMFVPKLTIKTTISVVKTVIKVVKKTCTIVKKGIIKFTSWITGKPEVVMTA